MNRLLPLLLVAFALAGCRESLTGPDPDPILPGEPAPAFPSMYVKASAPELREGAVSQIRAEYVPGVTHYEWSFLGTGTVTSNANDAEELDRILSVIGVSAGSVVITATAYDDAGNLLAVGTRTIEVVPY
jgi:hypothetical protein